MLKHAQQFLSKPKGRQALQAFQVVRYGSLLLLGILLAKSGISQADIGVYESFLFLGTMFSFFWVSGIINSLLALYPKKTAEEQQQLLFTVFLLTTGLSIAGALALALALGLAPSLLVADKRTTISWLLLGYFALMNPGYLVEYIYLLRDKASGILRYMLVAFGLQLVLVGFPIIFDWGLVAILGGLAISAAIRFLWAFILVVKHGEAKASFSLMREHLVLAWPLILSILLSGSAEYVDGIIVKARYTEATFGLFRYGAREFPLVLLLANALSAATIPILANSAKQGLAELKQQSSRLAHMLFPATAVLLIASKWLYLLVFSPEFAESALIFNIYLLLIIPRLVFPQTALIALHKNRYVLYSAAIELLLNVGLSLLFVQWWGLEGIALATVVAFTVDKSFLMISCKQVLGIKVSDYLNLKVHLPYAIALLLLFAGLRFGLW